MNARDASLKINRGNKLEPQYEMQAREDINQSKGATNQIWRNATSNC